MERFIRGGIAAAVLGGLLVAARTTLTVVSAGHQQFSDQVLTGVFTVSAALRFTGAILMTWGIISLYLAQADRAGRLGLIAVVACMANMALQTGWIFCDLFAAPSFAHAAPGVLNNPSGPLTAGFMAAWLANISFVLLGIATLRARVLPRTSRARADHRRCYHPGAVAGRSGPAYEVIIGIVFAIAGARALAGAARTPTCCKVSNLTAARTRLPTSAADHLQQPRAATAPPNRASRRPAPSSRPRRTPQPSRHRDRSLTAPARKGWASMSDDPPANVLMTRAASGDKQGWDALVERYAPLIWSICRWYQLSSADAADIGQAIWPQFMDQLGKVRDLAALTGWLATTTHQECRKIRRAAHGPQAAGKALATEAHPG